jgi:hypothetical protein
MYKKFQGSTWRGMLDAKGGLKYLQWASGNLAGPPQQEAIGFLAYVEANGGPEALRAKLG